MVECEAAQEVVAVDQHIPHVRALVVSGKLSQGEQSCDDAGRVASGRDGAGRDGAARMTLRA